MELFKTIYIELVKIILLLSIIYDISDYKKIEFINGAKTHFDKKTIIKCYALFGLIVIDMIDKIISH